MKRILIVDDSNTARMVMRRCLEIAGLEGAVFLEAGNGKEALLILKQQSAHLVVTDLNMPVMDGESLLKKIKASPRLNEIPVVVITSVCQPALEKRLIAMGAHAVLSKPISPTTILSSKAGSLIPIKQSW